MEAVVHRGRILFVQNVVSIHVRYEDINLSALTLVSPLYRSCLRSKDQGRCREDRECIQVQQYSGRLIFNVVSIE